MWLALKIFIYFFYHYLNEFRKKIFVFLFMVDTEEVIGIKRGKKK